MKKYFILSVALLLGSFSFTQAQKTSEVNMSQYGLPFTWKVPVAKPELLKVRVTPPSSEGGITIYTVETADKSFKLKIYQSTKGYTAAEKMKSEKASEKKSKVHTFKKFHTEEENLFIAEFQETGSTTTLYSLTSYIDHGGKKYDIYSYSKEGKYSETEIMAMYNAVKSIQFQD